MTRAAMTFSMLGLAAICVGGCAGNGQSPAASHLASMRTTLVLPGETMREVIAIDEAERRGWELSRNDSRAARTAPPIDQGISFLESRHYDRLRTTNGRVSESSYSRTTTIRRQLGR